MKKIIYVLFVCIFCQPQVYSKDVDPKAKYVFLFIGDGMGLAHITVTEGYRAALKGKVGLDKLSFTKFPDVAITSTYAKDRFITDSAGACTAIATGHKSIVETINMDETKTKKFTTIAEMAKAKGMKIGIISTTSMDDATPACFYAHQPDRGMSEEISKELLKSNFDYFAGGTFPKIRDMKKFVAKAGYTYADTKKEFGDMHDKNSKVYTACSVIDEEGACNYSIDQTSKDITLAEFTKKGIELLDGPNGFFMMIEAGKIDWAAHANDAGAVIKDIEALDTAVKEALKFYDQHPKETLVIVATDHETGGLSVGYAGTQYDSYFAKLKDQKISVKALDDKATEYRKTHSVDKAKLADLMPFIKNNFGLGKKGLELTKGDMDELNKAFTATMEGKKNHVLYGKHSIPISTTVSKILDQKAGLSWTTFSHTGLPTIVFAKGVGAELFRGDIDNTDVAKNIIKAAELK